MMEDVEKDNVCRKKNLSRWAAALDSRWETGVMLEH